ncbi:uncharacterized protein LOC100378893 [Saccoglossus kowalevskii]|uniref:Leucine-rich repeat-containing protein DDB_G0290503-like n=1 Tax=Saccoglossus kowalevskii TaxID=10224 RepID=A0ABM0H1H7_SACKO|nr:PREDICTED: putative leucine-rich repeat-containing protein DDB_G0290503-like [Saccoglossus kowalevskii]
MAEENYKLEDQIKEGKLKQKTLYKQLMETEKKLAVVEESLSKKCQEVEQLKVQDVEKADKKLTDLSELSEQLKMEVTSLNEKLIKSEETIKDLSHQNSELILDNKYDRDESEKLVTSMAEENYKLEDQIKEGKLKQKTLYKQLMETKEKLAAVEESLFKKCQEVEQVKVHDVERADTNLSEVNEQLKIEVTSLKEKLIKSEETIKDLSHQNSELILDNKYDRDESEKLVTSMAEENYKLEDQIKEGKLKQKTLFKQLMEEKAKITNMESKVVTLEEELRKKIEQLSACDNSIQTIQLLKQENSDKNTEIRKLQRDLLMTTDPLEEEIKYQKSQVVYHKQLADQFKRSLNKLQQKTSVTSDTVAEPTNEKVGLYRGSGIVETCVVTSVLKAQKAQLERDLERSKAKNVLLENKITEQTSLFFAETLQRKQIEDEAKRWKSKARVLYDKLQAKGKADETDSETEVTHKALQEAKADGIRVNSPVKSAPNIEKIPIKATQPVGSAHNGGQLNQENGVPRFTKFTEPKEDKAQCKQQ